MHDVRTPEDRGRDFARLGMPVEACPYRLPDQIKYKERFIKAYYKERDRLGYVD